MRRQILLLSVLLLAAPLTGFSQSKLVFTSNYVGNYHRLDSILIRDLNTGSSVLKHYPDTVLNLLITGNDEINDNDVRILHQNYPNPFERSTNIEIELPESGPVTMTLLDGSGRILSKSEKDLSAGRHSFTFTGGNRQLYFVSLQTRHSHAAIKMVCTGHAANSLPELSYTGSLHSSRNSRAAGGHFDFNTGDNIQCIGYMTDSAGSVVRDTIQDAPDRSKTYTFNFQRKNRIIILMYHKLTDSIPADEYQRNSTDFENDLKYLINNNFKVLSMEDLLLLADGEKKLDSNGVIITFDDGYESNYSIAQPILSNYNMCATFFLVTEWMGTPDYTTWSQVWLMSQVENDDGSHPFVMGSHSSSHPFLAQNRQNYATTEEYMNFLNNELGDSKEWITDITGQSTIFMSLPYGDGAYDQDIISVARAKGYSGIRTSIWDSLDPEKMNIFALPSVPILSDSPIDSIQLFFQY